MKPYWYGFSLPHVSKSAVTYDYILPGHYHSWLEFNNEIHAEALPRESVGTDTDPEENILIHFLKYYASTRVVTQRISVFRPHEK